MHEWETCPHAGTKQPDGRRPCGLIAAVDGSKALVPLQICRICGSKADAVPTEEQPGPLVAGILYSICKARHGTEAEITKRYEAQRNAPPGRSACIHLGKLIRRSTDRPSCDLCHVYACEKGVNDGQVTRQTTCAKCDLYEVDAERTTVVPSSKPSLRQPDACPHRRKVAGKIDCNVVAELAGPGYLWDQRHCIDCCKETVEPPTVSRINRTVAEMLVFPAMKQRRDGLLARARIVMAGGVDGEAPPSDLQVPSLALEPEEVHTPQPNYNEKGDRLIVYDAAAHGFGDALCVMWLVAGQSGHDGIEVVHHCPAGAKRELIEAFGQRCVDMPGAAINTFAAYGKEIQHAGKLGRMVFRAQALGLDPTKISRPTYTLRDDVRAWAKRVASSEPDRPKIVLLFPNTEWKPREWPPNYWIDLAWGLRRSGHRPLIVLGSNDPRFHNVPSYYYGHSWLHVMALMERAALVVGNDSGPAWLGGTMGVPTVALVGPTSPVVFAPLGDSIKCHRVSEMQLPCVGCHFNPPYRAACDQGCMALYELVPSAVLRATRSILEVL